METWRIDPILYTKLVEEKSDRKIMHTQKSFPRVINILHVTGSAAVAIPVKMNT